MAKLPAVEGLTADEFDGWLKYNWKQGQHVGICAPTGEGKTTLACQMMLGRRFVLALDPKGGDETLIATGWPRLTKWPPPRKVYEQMSEGVPQRFLVGPIITKWEQMDHVSALQATVLKATFDDGKWTVYIDEAQLAGDARFMALGENMERLLISARSRKVSLITSFQQPVKVPKACYQQASWVAIAQTLDRDAIARCAEVIGRSAATVRGCLDALPQNHFLIAGRSPRQPLLVVHPRYLAPKKG